MTRRPSFRPSPVWPLAAVCAVLLPLLAACAGSSSGPPGSGAQGIEQPHLKVAIISVTATYVPLYLAVDDGLFAKEGLQVELLPFRGGSDLIKAVVAGSADVGVVSLAEVASGIAAGQKLKAFYGGFNVPAFDWYAIPSIHTLGDAKGKRFGVTQYGSSTDFLTRYALASNGIDPAKDVQIVQGGDSPTRLAAMQAGQIDVNIFAAPDTFVAAQRGYTRILRQKDLAPDYPYHVFGAMEPFIASHPNTIRALLRGFVLGLRAAKRDKPHAIEALVKRIQMDPAYAAPTYDDLIDYLFEDGRLPSEKGLDLFFEMGIKAGRFTEHWPRERYWTPSFADTYPQWKPAE
jgi:ABC-type nitrate/sulfonate/bicarbonate transport system substrate-binding protein